eukprot:COSAG02_NODE_7044_length_3213_cov_1.195890_1_plen_101_part_00
MSTTCDEMLEQLNAISFLGDTAHSERCNRLRQSLNMLNRGQGMGFRVLGTVVDRRLLYKAAAFSLSASGGLITWATQTAETGLDNEEQTNISSLVLLHES